jgi:hypothetical protein
MPGAPQDLRKEAATVLSLQTRASIVGKRATGLASVANRETLTRCLFWGKARRHRRGCDYHAEP